jgi:hypothetical protein
MPAWGLRVTPWPDIVVAAIVAYLVISAVKVPRQTVGEMRGVHVLQGAPSKKIIRFRRSCPGAWCKSGVVRSGLYLCY